MADTHRLFFALWPDDKVRAAIASAAADLGAGSGGHAVPVGHYHITLVFLAAVSTEQLPCVLAAGDRVRGTPVYLRLDHFGHFRRARVAWLGMTDVPPALLALEQQLRKALAYCQVELETRPFNPHLTLARKVVRTPSVEDPSGAIGWQANEFVLVESQSSSRGSSYHVLRRWPLGNNEGRGSRGEAKEGLPPPG